MSAPSKIKVAQWATGGVGKAAATLGSTFGGFFADLTATPVPSATVSLLSDAPLLEEPGEPYTNQPTIDLVGTIPAALVGSSDSQLRLYVALGDQRPGVVTEIPVGRTAKFIVPGVTLIEGPNAFTATIVGPSGETDPSPVVTFVYDPTNPKVTITSPIEGATVNATTVTIIGKTQARSTLQARNASTNETVNGQADANGAFSMIMPIVDGTNDIGVTAIDPAGNETRVVLAVRQGAGMLAASVDASVSRIRLRELPKGVRLTVVVTDPDGRPLEGARVTFTLAVKNVRALTSKMKETAGDGTATWLTTIPPGAETGPATATVTVKTTAFGDTTDEAVISIVK